MKGPLLRYIALGDSSGVGVGANDDGGYPERLFRRLKAAGHPVGILNLARSGATSTDLRNTQLERAVSKRPGLVTLGIGTNDVWRLVSPEYYADNLNHIADRLQSTGAQVVVCNIVDLAHAPAATAAEAWLGVSRHVVTERIREFNARIAALAQRPRFQVVDLFTFSQVEVPSHPEYFCGDGFHPSPPGYDRWTDLCWPVVERAARAWAAETGVSGSASASGAE